MKIIVLNGSPRPAGNTKAMISAFADGAKSAGHVGRCGHICNASYAVSSDARGRHIGEQLVLDCLKKGKEFGFRVLQFNAVVESNTHARHLYERLGFTQLGTIPGGFRMKDGHYENICPYYHEL